MSDERFRHQLREVARERVSRIRSRLRLAGGGHGTDAEAQRREALREAHTLKGEARITGQEDIAELAHAFEEKLQSTSPAALEEARELLGALEDAVSASLDGAPAGAPHGRTDEPALQHALLRVDLDQVVELTRACSELRALHGDFSTLATELTALAGEASTGSAAGVPPRLRDLAARARDLAFEHDQRTEVLEHDLRAIRMLPLGRLFAHLRYAAQQVADELEKPIEIHVEGDDLAVDRQVLDIMSEPLLHLVRNAVDHGLETPDERERRGKSAVGTLGMAAEQVGRVVHLTIEDDGAGIDLDGVRETMVRRGLWNEDVAAEAGREALLDQLFSPGFSTRNQVSRLSGRGLGLDIVRRRAESIGGTVLVLSEAGHGTSFVVSVPVSMVADPVVPVEVDGAVYALATNELTAMRELTSLATDLAGDAAVVQVDEQLVPLRDLGELLGGRPRTDRASVVVIEAGSGALALAVDRLLPVSAAIRQALDPFLEGLDVVRGAVVIEGRLVTLLDARELIRRSERSAVAAMAPEDAQAPPRVLVVDDSELTRDVLVSTLVGLGCRVNEAMNGARALELLRAEPIDLVVTDLDMPVMDGFELLRCIRGSGDTSRLPVIVMTTRAAREDLEKAAALGADAYLTKSSFRTDELADLVRRHTQGSRG